MSILKETFQIAPETQTIVRQDLRKLSDLLSTHGNIITGSFKHEEKIFVNTQYPIYPLDKDYFKGLMPNS